ncbi:putative type IX secretion system sortase PorU2 [Neolewinella litorea]|nr:C25 family cysteine peptidase [Neolewinella litorea]
MPDERPSMPRTFTLFLLLSLFFGDLMAQIPVGQDTLHGNEWYVPGQQYLRIEVARDGLYQIGPDALIAAGFPASESEGQRYRLYHRGEIVPLDISPSGLAFYGRQARGEMDSLLFPGGSSEQLNPRYGMYTDTAAYYLTTVESVDGADRYVPGDGSGGPVVTTIQRTAERLFTDVPSKYFQRSSGSTIQFSHYELAEGYGQRANNDLLSSNGTTSSTVDLALPGAVDGAAELTLRFGLAFGNDHRQRITVNGQTVDNFISEDWSVNELSYPFSLSGKQATLKIDGLAGDQDKANLAYVTVTYPAAATLDGIQLPFTLPAGDALTLAFTGNTSTARLYDLTNGRVYTPVTAGRFNLPAAATPRSFVLASAFLAPAGSVPLVLNDYLPPAATDYLIISSRRLAGPGLDALANYRRSGLGGAYRVHVAYVEDLYEAFGFGLRRHPQAIRNYLAAAMERAPNLQYLFLIGKGREYTSLRSADNLAAAWSTFFVPSFGLPASDNLLSAPLGSVLPRLSTGRLAAITPAEVALYARKLEDVERQITLANQTVEDLDWMKQALFLGGGQSAGEQASIRYNLGTMEQIFETSKFGGNVNSVFRTSSEPIEDARTETIFDRINAGTSIITFYGHSSSEGFDFNIDNPDNYENVGKYPFMMSLGCYSGDAFTSNRSISERFIFLPDGGAITFAASKGLGYISALGTYGRSVFQHLGNDQYGEGIGDVLRAAIADYAGTNNFTLGILLEQFSLSGDPAFRFHPRPGPDLVIDPASVKFEPTVIPAQDSSFSVSLRVMNLGTRPDNLPDSVTLRFRQELPGGTLVDLGLRTVEVPYYENPLTISLPNTGFDAVGLNRLHITVDAGDTITELPAPAAEVNNNVVIGGRPGAPFTVVANTAKTAYPPDFAVIGPGQSLVAGSSDPLAPERKYRIQMARESDFRTTVVDDEITAPGGVIRYTPSLTYTDSATYYWRISPDSSQTLGAGYLWSESSFTYLADQAPEQVGFAVADPGQFIEGTIENIELDPRSADWNYTRTVNDIEIFNGVYESREMPRLVWNGTRFNSPHPWKIRTGIQVMVVDSINNSIWYRAGDGSYNTPTGTATPWSFDTRTAAGRHGLIRFLEEFVQDGQYVFVYSVQRGTDLEYHNEDWLTDSTEVGRTIYGMLEEEGAEQIRLLESLGSVPYTFGYQKGFGPLAEAVATSQDAQTYVLIPIQENWQRGNYTAPPIGPALEWTDLTIKFSDAAIGPADSSYFQLIGQTPTGERRVLQEYPLDIRSQRTFTVDLRAYDAREYPYILPAFQLYDETERTVATIEKIFANYRRPGDVAVSPAVAYSVPERLDQGQVGNLEIGYENVSPIPMDSLLVELTVVDESNEVTTLRKRQPPLAGNGSGKAVFTLPTQDIASRLRVQLRLNPERDQPEDVLFNNLLTTDLGVEVDYVAPDLKVYYDGRIIRDGELVSAKPEILIQLRDENEFRRLDDSSAYTIQLTGPDGNKETIRLSDERVEFVPAPADGANLAEVYFRPELLQDGVYSLVVQASDRARNRAGALEYQQTFEVINQQLITNVLTYPNPFTTQTRFVYTLTGSTPPEVFRIQIMTVSGRVVRDIDLLAHENVTVGTHRTDFTWDGTDEYGDLLANGVYLYRVITSDGNGDSLEAYDNGTDQFFANGLGKVVILR